MKHTSIKLSCPSYFEGCWECDALVTPNLNPYGQVVDNWLFPTPVYLERVFHGQYCNHNYLHALIASDLHFVTARTVGRGSICHRKASSAFTSSRKLPLQRQSCKNCQPDWSKPSIPTQSILWVWPASWWDAWGSVEVSQCPQDLVGLHIWIWGQIVHLRAQLVYFIIF